MRDQKQRRPLSGIRVIDFGQYIAGPAAAMMMADMGAEVIRVEKPGGPAWKDPATSVLNRGKKSLILNLKDAADLSTARTLITTADVLIENFRPGVMERLGLGPSIRQHYPRLVYLSLPGFSSKDRERRHLPAWEAIIAAACGQFTDMGLNRILMGINPSFSPLPLASAYAAAMGAMAVMMALYKREQTSRGDTIEVPIASAVMEGFAYNVQYVEGYPERYKGHREREIERRRSGHEAMDLGYDALQELLDPFYRNYICADGRPFYVVSASHKDHPVRVLKILGLWKEMKADGLPLFDAYLNTDEWPPGKDCTLANYPMSKRWADKLSSRMKQAFLSKTAFEWEALFGDGGAPGAAQRTTKEWLASDHALQSGLVLKIEDTRLGPMRQAGNVAWLKSDAEMSLKKEAAPEPDQHREEILTQLTATPGPATEDVGTKTGGWLDGIRILDLTNVIAGPTIATTLSRFGADVISIDPVRPTMDPWNTIIFGMQANRGKRSALVNLKSSAGKQVLERLLKAVDIVTVNALNHQLAPLGLDEERIRQVNPSLLLCQLDCYGAPATGPRSNYPGYDDLAQASTGVMQRFGGGMGTPEEHAHFGTIDVLGGFCAAFAVGAALLKRERTGEADTARSSLCAAGNLIQLPFMYDYDGRPPFDEPSGRWVKGRDALYRAYQAADGWFFLAACNGMITDLEQITTLHGISSCSGTNTEEFLEQKFIQQPLSYWVNIFSDIDIGVQPLVKMHDLRESSLSIESIDQPDLQGPTFSFTRFTSHPSGRTVDLVAPNAIRPVEASIRIPGHAPKYGAHTREILTGLEFSTQQIDAWMKEGNIGESWSKDYLPV